MQRRGPGGPGPPHFYTKLRAGGAKNLFWRPPPPPPYYGSVWDTSTRRSHSAQITSPRVVRKSCLIHRFLSPLLHEQIQIHRRYSILEKTCSCNRIKLNCQATKKKIESTRKHRRLGSKFCDRLHHNYVTCSKNKENTLTQLKFAGKRHDSLDDRPPLISRSGSGTEASGLTLPPTDSTI